jgi:hypothetical protein
MAFRQYRRASSGIDAGVQQLLFWLTLITAPVWVPLLLIVGAYQYVTSNSTSAIAEKARIEAVQKAERLQEERQRQAAEYAEAHAPWDKLRCEALFVRTDRALGQARDGSDSAAVEVSRLRQQATDHGCKR